MRLILCAALTLGSMTAQTQTLEIAGPKQSVKFSLRELKRKLKSQSIRVDDPVYKKSMTYDAFALPEVLALAGLKAGDKADELVFTALDGYAPNMEFATLKERKAYLAYQEHGRPGFAEGFAPPRHHQSAKCRRVLADRPGQQ